MSFFKLLSFANLKTRYQDISNIILLLYKILSVCPSVCVYVLTCVRPSCFLFCVTLTQGQMLFLVNATPPINFKFYRCIGHLMQGVLGNILCDLDVIK